MTTTERQRPLLDLDTLIPDRPFVRIDGERYDLAVPADFGLVGQVKITRIMERLAPLNAKLASDPDGFTDDDVDEVSRLLAAMTALVLLAPPEVLARLSDLQRQQVVTAFTTASATKAGTPTLNRAARRRTGARSSRASRPPTASTTG